MDNRNSRAGFKQLAPAMLLLVLLSGCAGQILQHQEAPIPHKSAWVLLPVRNLAEAPHAGARIEDLLAARLRARGLELHTYPARLAPENGFPPTPNANLDKARKWAKKQGFRYAVTGTVNEWRYKSGLDGEPAVGVTLRVIDLKEDRVVWTASGSRTGWGFQSVSGTADTVLGNLVGGLELK
ncbi:MAG TPA: hypothetical protein VKA48_06500 [Gammaproteobacteria bacterium]|nr:hypothetical protein [Gammaproteobacteria bacterium]